MINYPLEDNEKIVKICRKHWLLIAIDIVALAVLLVLPYLGYSFVSYAFSYSIGGGAYQIAQFFYMCWFILLWIYFFVVWTNTYLDAWVITTKRIIDVDQIGLFKRTMSDFRMESIQNITIEEKSFIGNLFKYGAINVETAGEKTELRFDFLPNPYIVRDIISEQHDKCLNRLEHGSDNVSHHNTKI